MTKIDEIAPDLYRISVLHSELNMQFNHFLVKDDEPLLFHTGMRRMFPAVQEAVGKLIDPASLRWIGWSHFEVDECGALNEWLAVAPKAQSLRALAGTRPRGSAMGGRSVSATSRSPSKTRQSSSAACLLAAYPAQRADTDRGRRHSPS